MKISFGKSYLLLIVVTIFLSCNKDEDFLFRINIPITNFIFDVNLSTFTEHFLAGNNGSIVQIDLAQQFQNAGYNLNEIETIIPGQARLTASFDEHRLNFIRAMSVRICPSPGPNCGREVFYRDPVPQDAGFTLGLIPSAIGDVKDVLMENQFFIQLKLEDLFSSPGRTFQGQLEMDFKVQ